MSLTTNYKSVSKKVKVEISNKQLTNIKNIKQIDSIRFEKKILHIKSADNGKQLMSKADFTQQKSQHPNTRCLLKQQRKNVEPWLPRLRCLLDSGNGGGISNSNTRFQAYVIAENLTRRPNFALTNLFVDPDRVVDYDFTIIDPAMKKKQLYNRFRATLVSTFNRKKYPISQLQSPPTKSLMVNTKQ